MNALPAADMNSSPTLSIASELLGALEIPEDSVLDFPQGIFGFPEAKGFVVLPAERDGFYWLQSLEFSALTFLAIDPFVHIPDFSVELNDDELGPLGPAEPTDMVVLAIVTLPRTPDAQPTANLQGPVAINVARRVGRQLVIQDSEYGTRHPLPQGPRPVDD